MKNAAITYLAGETFCRNPMVMVYANSLKDCFEGDRIMLTHEMGEVERKKFAAMGYEIVNVAPPMRSHVFFHRWTVLYEFLCSRQYKYVVMADAKDVFWQRDPCEDMVPERVFLCDEGVIHAQCRWNSQDQEFLMRTLRRQEYDYKYWRVVNGGFIGGSKVCVKDFAFLMSMMTTVGGGPISDQCYINFLYHNRKNEPYCNYTLVNPDIHPFVATGNTMKTQRTPYQWKDGRLFDGHGRMFALFHQWDRTEHRGEILTHHGQGRCDD
jgi:hypothetical protein